MNLTEVKNKINGLRLAIEDHNYNYYIMDNPLISDYEFDMMLEELIGLEKQYPQFHSPLSPSQRVGGGIIKDFPTVTHKYPMYSLSNSYSIEEIQEFENRAKKVIHTESIEYVCELKYDGVAISILYENGELIRGVTRGNGTEGDDITANIKTIRSIPLKLRGQNFPKTFEMKGEVIMPLKHFHKLNEYRIEIGDDPFANPRNTTSGTLKMQDSSIVAKRKLECFCYAINFDEENNLSQFDSLQLAKEWGFKVSENIKVCENINEITSYINYWDKKRENLGFETDGIVIKVNSSLHQKKLGFTSKFPRWAIAYKFKTEQTTTQLLEVSYQVGRTGAITPVANLNPVKLGGTIVKRASLHNADQIQKLDIHDNDWVLVEKGGEIIPKIVGVLSNKRKTESDPVKFISHCPECNAFLIKLDNGAQHYCPNIDGCPTQIKGRIEHFISRKAMNIDSMGAETIELLYKEKLIHNIADIYSLKKDDLIPLERMAEKSASNIIDGIQKSKEIPFEKVLYALGIRHVGETVAKKIARTFKNIDLLAAATKEDLINTDEIGEVIADSIITFFSTASNIEIIDKLKAAGLKFTIENNTFKKNPNITNKSFVVSGVFKKFSRDGIKEEIEKMGGKILSSVSSKTDYLLAGEKMGPAKLKKATDLNVSIINESDILKMLASHNNHTGPQLNMF